MLMGTRAGLKQWYQTVSSNSGIKQWHQTVVSNSGIKQWYQTVVSNSGIKQWYQTVQVLIKYEVTDVRKTEKYFTFLDSKMHRT